MMKGLKHCPFCGGKVELREKQWVSRYDSKRKMNYLQIACSMCPVYMDDLPYKPDTPICDIEEYKQKLIERWNERVS